MDPRKVFSRAMMLLLLILGSSWSHGALAARAPTQCNLASNAPTSQNGFTGGAVAFSFQVVNIAFCNGAVPGNTTTDTITIASDTTGGASIIAPAPAQYVGGANAYVPFTLQFGPSAGTVTVNVTCTAFCGPTPTLTYTATAVVPNPQLTLGNAVTGSTDPDNSGNVSPGDVLTYTETARNSGNVVLNSVTVRSSLTPATQFCDPLPVNATCTLTFSYTVTSTDATNTRVTNLETVNSKQLAAQTNSLNTAVAASPAMTLNKTFVSSTDPDSSGNLTVGDVITYNIRVSNGGGSNLTNIIFSDPGSTVSGGCTSLVPGNACNFTATHTVDAADLRAGRASNTASATSTQFPGGVTSNTVNTAVFASPALTVSKSLTGNTDNDKSGNVTVGDVLAYQIQVRNTGGGALTNVVVNDVNAVLVPTACANLPIGNTCTWTASHAVTAADLTAGVVRNKATATSTQVTTAVSSNTVSTRVLASPSMTVLKTLVRNADGDGSGTVTEGDRLTYTVTATNNGGSALTNVTVTDPLTSPGSRGCARVAIGGTCTLSGDYIVTRNDVGTGNIANTGKATSDQFPAGLTSTLNTTVFTSPKATVTKVLAFNKDGDHSGTVTVGDLLTYTVTGTNAGNVTLNQMTVTDPLTTPNTITCTNVAIGGTCVLNGIYTVTATDLRNGQISNTGTATSPQLRAPVTTTLNTPVTATPGMTITKVLTSNADGDHSGTVTTGDVLTYTVTATNSGATPLTNVVVNDPLTTPATKTCANLAVGTTCALAGTYTVTAGDARTGQIRNTGSASARELTKSVSATLDTQVGRSAPGLTVAKVLAGNADGDGNGIVTQGDVLTYTVTATNSGSEILNDVVVSDPLTSPSSTTCSILQIGAACVLTGTYTVTAADVARGTIANTGTAAAKQLTVSVPSNTVTEPVVTTTSMSVTKVLTANADGDGSKSVTPGDVLTYTVTATNTGNVPLATVTVNDPLTAPATKTCANVTAGATCVLTGSYTVTNADATNGSISNTGSATAGAQITTPVTQTLSTPVTTLSRTIAIVSGNNQSGNPNSTLPAPLVVSVLNSGNPATGTTINWLVTSGTATLASATSVVDASGHASNTLNLGATLGTVTVSATRADDNTVSTSFTATIAGPTLSLVSGNNQVGVVGADAVQPLVVRALDGNGQPLVGQAVNWQVVSGPAIVTTPSSVTDASGNTQIGFAYGASTGAIVIRANLGASSVDFNASAQAYRVAILGGNNQSAAPGQPLPQDFVVQVSFPTGMTTLARTHGAGTHALPSLSGVQVNWSVLSGGGSLSQGATTLTDVSGHASNHYTLGNSTGLNQVQVAVPGGTTATFSINSVAGNAALAIVSGSGQKLVPDTASQPLVVQVTDNGVPLSGVTVNWVASNNATLASPTSVTDSTGKASNTAQVTAIGAATVTASTVNPATSPVVFGLNGGLSFIAGLSPIQGQVTGALDNSCAALAAMSQLTPAQQDLLAQCNALASSAGQDPGQALGAIDQLFSDTAYLETSAAMLISTTQFDNIKARIAALRSGTGGDHFGGLAFNTPDGSLPVGSLAVAAFNGLSGNAKDKTEAGTGFDRWGFFLSGTFSHGSSDPRQYLPGYGFNTNGITAGVDYRFSDKFIAGISAGYAKYRADLDAQYGGMDTRGWTLSGYATFFRKDNWYVDGVLSWGSNSYDLTRKIVYTLTGPAGTTTVNQLANGNDSGNTLAAALTVGRDFNKGPWSFGPYFRGTWTRVDFDGYQEVLQPGIGSGLGLDVQTHTLKSTATVLGAKVNYASSQSWGVMMPHAEVEWQHEFQDNPDTITAHFLADPTKTPITAFGFPVDQDYFRLGLGVSFVFPQGRSGFVYYEKTLGRSGISQDSIALGLRLEF